MKLENRGVKKERNIDQCDISFNKNAFIYTHYMMYIHTHNKLYFTMEKHYRINITLPGSISEELNHVAEELKDKKSHIIAKALELYFDELDIEIAERRLNEVEKGKEVLIPAEEVWKDLGLD